MGFGGLGFGVWGLGFRVEGPPTLAACWMGKGGPPQNAGGGGGVGGGPRAAFPCHTAQRFSGAAFGAGCWGANRVSGLTPLGVAKARAGA